jgi:hypothetical protein
LFPEIRIKLTIGRHLERRDEMGNVYYFEGLKLYGMNSRNNKVIPPEFFQLIIMETGPSFRAGKLNALQMAQLNYTPQQHDRSHHQHLLFYNKIHVKNDNLVELFFRTKDKKKMIVVMINMFDKSVKISIYAWAKTIHQYVEITDQHSNLLGMNEILCILERFFISTDYSMSFFIFPNRRNHNEHVE